MFTLLTPLLRLFTDPAPMRTGDPVQQLLERAGASAGHNPRQARELRQAAFAWLRVVR